LRQQEKDYCKHHCKHTKENLLEGGRQEGGKCPDDGGRSELAAREAELPTSPDAACSLLRIPQ